MSSMHSIPDEQRSLLQKQIVPAYQEWGPLALVYLPGSLMADAHDVSALDVMLVWGGECLPIQTQYERSGGCFDGYKIHHVSLITFLSLLHSVLDGGWSESELYGEFDPVGTVGGLYYGEIVLDETGLGEQFKRQLTHFPSSLRPECQRVLQDHIRGYKKDLASLAAREDWLLFHSTLLAAVRMTLRTLFSAHALYYPGDKNVRQSIIHAGLQPQLFPWFDRLWTTESGAEGKIAALSYLMDLAVSTK